MTKEEKQIFDKLSAVRELRSAFDLLWYHSAMLLDDTHPITECIYVCATKVIGSHAKNNINDSEWMSILDNLLQSLEPAFKGDMRGLTMEESFNKWIDNNKEYWHNAIQST